VEVVAVDWSGAAHGASEHIWTAHVVDGELVTLVNGRSRGEVIDDLVALRARSRPLVVGLDFSFSFPAWFVRALGSSTVGELWSLVGREGERWLAACAAPFWGRPGSRRPELAAHLRWAERQVTVGGICPKSVFQIGGAGSVGTGSVRGMPHLPQLREAGFSIWPFDEPSPWTVVEIYPRLLTGPVRKSSRERRANYLAAARWSVGPGLAASIIGSEDAFDAAISALVMHDHRADLAELRPARDRVRRLEGDLWRPPKIVP
jgi:Protein of unknown function (DUF429)